MNNSRIYFLFFATFLVSYAYAQEHNTQIKVYLLGTFHFAQTDSTYNVLDDKHQKSINQLNDIIVGVNPDKIFIERMPDFENENKIDSLYTAYLSRTKETNNPNEIWQVAFKTAKGWDIKNFTNVIIPACMAVCMPVFGNMPRIIIRSTYLSSTQMVLQRLLPVLLT